MYIKVEFLDNKKPFAQNPEVKEMFLMDVYLFLKEHPRACFSVDQNISYLVDNFFEN